MAPLGKPKREERVRDLGHEARRSTPWFVVGMIALEVATLVIGFGIVQRYNDRTVEIHTAALQACHRQNTGRVATIKTDLVIAAGNRARAHANGESAAQARADLTEARAVRIAATTLADAQHAVAAHPNALKIPKRSRVDCQTAVK